MPNTITPSGTYASRSTAAPNVNTGPPTGRLFGVVYTAKGSVADAKYVGNMTDFETEFGGRLSVSPAYDSLDAYFLLGGQGGYLSRNALSTITSATANLSGSSGIAAVATAKSPGTWANGATFDVVNSTTTFTVKITLGTLVEQSYSLATVAELTSWANKFSTLFNFAAGGGSGLPITASAVAATGGTDNTAVDATSCETALARFDDQYGEGTVIMPGLTSSVLHRKALAHIASRPRTASLDLADGDQPTAVAAAQNLYQYAGRERATLNASTLVLPGGPLNATREVPWSVVIAAHASRSDASGAPGQALAGQERGAVTANGVPITGAYLKRQYSEADQGFLEAAGVTYAEHQVLGGTIGVPVTAADRTISDYNDQTVPTEYSDARVLMTAEGRMRRALAFVNFGSLGGDGGLVAAATGACIPLLADLYQAGVIGDGSMAYRQAYSVTVIPDRPNKRIVVTASIYCAVSARIVQINIVHYVGA